MPSFSQRSLAKLNECHPELQRLFSEVIKYYDCAIICGFRSEKEQHDVFTSGKSKLDWPKSKHNSTPSLAVDVMPFPINWNDEKRMHHFIGFVKGTAIQMGIDVISGHDWDDDMDLENQKFQDSPHWEIK